MLNAFHDNNVARQVFCTSEKFVIFKEGGNVRGLNTAATIWCSAAIGVLTGLGALHLAVVLAVAVLLTTWCL